MQVGCKRGFPESHRKLLARSGAERGRAKGDEVQKPRPEAPLCFGVKHHKPKGTQKPKLRQLGPRKAHEHEHEAQAAAAGVAADPPSRDGQAIWPTLRL